MPGKLFAVLSTLALFAAQARQVAPTTTDLRNSIVGLANHDTLMLPAGTYTANSQVWIDRKSHIGIISADGPGTAVIEGPGEGPGHEMLTFNLCSDIVLDGLEIRHGADNNVKIGGCSNVLIKNCYIHTAHGQGDCIKVTVGGNNVYSTDITIRGCIVHTAGLTAGGGAGSEFEENIDFMCTRRALVEDCWLFHVDTLGNQLGYAKGGCEQIVYNRCLFGPQSSISWDPAVGGGWQDMVSGFNVTGQTVKNCLFVNCPSGAIGLFGNKDVYIYNNTFVNCAHRTRYSPTPLGIIHAKSGGSERNSESVAVVNNIFYNNAGKDMYVFCTQGVTVTGVSHSNNLYHNQGAALRSQSVSGYDPAGETGSVTENPYASGAPPALFPTRTQTYAMAFAALDSLRRKIVSAYRPPDSSPASSAGANLAATVGDDILGNVRSGTWDIGAWSLSGQSPVRLNAAGRGHRPPDGGMSGNAVLANGRRIERTALKRRKWQWIRTGARGK
jgi:hypothetical protein